MFSNLGFETNLFDFDLLLCLAGLAVATSLFIQELAVIEQAANRWIGCWRHLYQIQVSIFSQPKRFTDGKDPQLLASLVD